MAPRKPTKANPLSIIATVEKLAKKTAPDLPPVHEPHPPSVSLRGRRNGHCQEETCQKPGATFYNLDKHAWYCQDCAYRINRSNRMRSKFAVGIVKTFGRVCISGVLFDQHFIEQGDPRFDAEAARKEEEDNFDPD